MTTTVLLRLLIGIVGCYTVVFLFGTLHNHFKESKTIRISEKIGKFTLSIYLIQHIIVEILLPKTVNSFEIHISKSIFYDYVAVPIISLVLLVIMYWFVALLNKSKYTKWLFGFKSNLKNNNS
jgi:uncharacterized membrane protein YeiB